VANAVRHGGATRVELGLGRGPHALVLTIDDNGRGFPLDEVANAPRSLNERIDELGGTLVISSHPGATRVGITLPLKGRT
ncbi:sensor histidine kinase, partial [Novosphingobium sp.]|uniref:sensor histidine kinase n=1 Tax=Novosphingobium sp. TaxID=1874826 RepID=UPI0035B2A247